MGIRCDWPKPLGDITVAYVGEQVLIIILFIISDYSRIVESASKRDIFSTRTNAIIWIQETTYIIIIIHR